MAEPPSNRLAYLDWLRFLVVLMLTPFHGALSFTGLGVVYVYDTPVRDAFLAGHMPADPGPIALRLLTVFLDNWFMHLLFFISGVGAATALARRNAREFARERINRLVLPLVLGTVTVVAAQVWLRALSFGSFSGSFWKFYPHFFNGIHTTRNSPGNFEYSHLWFLAYLFTFSMIALPMFERSRRQGKNSRWLAVARRLSEGTMILSPALGIGLLEALLRPGWPGFQNLINDWANFTVYLAFFLLGYLAGRDQAMLAAAAELWPSALLLGLFAFAVRVGLFDRAGLPPGYSIENMVAKFMRGLASYCLVIGIVGWARGSLTREGWALAWARDLAFPLYLLHFLPLTAATYLLLNTGWSVWTRWSLAVLAAWGVVALFTLMARWVPPLRRFLGIKPPDRGHAPVVQAFKG